MIAKTKTIKKISMLIAYVAVVASFTILMQPSAPVSAAPPIPPGCPGSTDVTPVQSDRPNPVCATIPLGCPGSTQTSNNPRQADYVPPNCPYENVNGSPGVGSTENRNSNTTRGENGVDACGEGESRYSMSIDIGCLGRGNAIMDAAFAIIRFLSYGVGLVLIASLVFAGIQYTTSRGDPKSTAAALTRIKTTIGALLLFIFGFAILNYIVPNGILK